jgi:CMP-N-acetylneuraminic acid synthetase
MNVLGVIPARGGSKGIPTKNLAPICGRPLLAYTADAVKESKTLTRAIVSTDDQRIADCARSLGLEVPFMRPSSLAADDAPMLPVLQHAIDAMRATGFEADIVVLLQPTSPLRRGEHIDAAVDCLQRMRGDSVVSVVEVPHQFNPTSVMRLDDGLLRPFLETPAATRRQDKPRVYARNGPAVLAVHARVLESGSLYGDHAWPLIMTAEESLDIDTPWDLRLAESVIAARSNANSLQTRF